MLFWVSHAELLGEVKIGWGGACLEGFHNHDAR